MFLYFLNNRKNPVNEQSITPGELKRVFLFKTNLYGSRFGEQGKKIGSSMLMINEYPIISVMIKLK